MAKSEILKIDGVYFWCIIKGNDCENRKSNFLGGEGVWHLDSCLFFIHRGVCFAAGRGGQFVSEKRCRRVDTTPGACVSTTSYTPGSC